MAFAGIPSLGGAVIMYAALSGASSAVMASGLAFAAGAAFFVILDQLTPVIKNYSRRHEAAISLFLGVFLGILLLGL